MIVAGLLRKCNYRGASPRRLAASSSREGPPPSRRRAGRLFSLRRRRRRGDVSRLRDDFRVRARDPRPRERPPSALRYRPPATLAPSLLPHASPSPPPRPSSRTDLSHVRVERPRGDRPPRARVAVQPSPHGRDDARRGRPRAASPRAQQRGVPRDARGDDEQQRARRHRPELHPPRRGGLPAQAREQEGGEAHVGARVAKEAAVPDGPEPREPNQGGGGGRALRPADGRGEPRRRPRGHRRRPARAEHGGVLQRRRERRGDGGRNDADGRSARGSGFPPRFVASPEVRRRVRRRSVRPGCSDPDAPRARRRSRGRRPRAVRPGAPAAFLRVSDRDGGGGRGGGGGARGGPRGRRRLVRRVLGARRIADDGSDRGPGERQDDRARVDR